MLKSIFVFTSTLMISTTSSALALLDDFQNLKIGDCRDLSGEMLSRRLATKQYLIESTYGGGGVSGVLLLEKEIDQPTQLSVYGYWGKVSGFVTVYEEMTNGFRKNYRLPWFKNDLECKLAQDKKEEEDMEKRIEKERAEMFTALGKIKNISSVSQITCNEFSMKRFIEANVDASATCEMAFKVLEKCSPDLYEGGGLAEEKCLKEMGALSDKEKKVLKDGEAACKKSAKSKNADDSETEVYKCTMKNLLSVSKNRQKKK